jgi:excisionase family DNA binding protein
MATEGRTYLTPPQVRDRLQLSERTVWRRLKDGTIPSVRVGRLVRIDEQELERALRGPS